ncbi:MAG TPA: siroheme synthase CysG [Gammaproteobacteria bacterium]
MRHLPLFAQLKDRPCLIVGGGTVAERRARLLLEAGARVTVKAPEIGAGLRALAAAEPRLALELGELAAADVEPYWLIVAATDDRAVNARVAAAAERGRRFCNVVDDAALSSFIMPAIVDRDPITIAVSSGGRSPVVSRHVKGLIEALLPFRIGALARLAGAWRERVRAALPDADDRRRFWQHVVQGRVAAECVAGRDDAAATALEQELDAWRSGRIDAAREPSDAADPAEGRPGPDARRSRGEAWLVGAGPGNPELITLKGRQLLADADAVLYDRLGTAKLLQFARRDAELISVGKTPGRPSITQAQINRLLVQLVASGKRVCRLKGGDPMVFGRAGEELDALVQAGLPFQIVPGVSAVEGCAGYAGIPLTLRGVSRTLLISTGRANDDDSGDLASFRPGQTLALYMGVGQYGTIASDLIRLGHSPDTPAAIVENGTTDEQRVILTVLRLLPRATDALRVRPPALLVIGETARLAERYGWFGPSRLEVFDDRAARGLARVS